MERRLTTHDMPQHNGVAESLNCRLMERVRALLHQSGLPPILWAEVLHFVVWVKNCTLMKALGNLTPFEKLTGKKPYLAGVPKWGQCIWVHTNTNSKLGVRAKLVHWVGYSRDSTHTHCIYWAGAKKISTERVVKFTASTATISITSSSFSTLLAPALPLQHDASTPSTTPAPTAPTQAASAPPQPPATTDSGKEEVEVKDKLTNTSPPPAAWSRSAQQQPGAPKKSKSGQATQPTRQSSRVRKPLQYARQLASGEGTADGRTQGLPG